MEKYTILFVCTDNMCSSPTAEGVLRQKASQSGMGHRIAVASAATHDLNTDEPMDYHAQKHAMRRGYDLSSQRAKLLQPGDFEHFDLILAMQTSNLQTLRDKCPTHYQGKIQLFTSYCNTAASQDLPDLFYGKPEDFEQVLDIIEEGCDTILMKLQQMDVGQTRDNK